ncbi:MAG: hypothetical protein H6718_29835 [Polyangiaceae bacterium]|nr:hypothetical protein [Myxococcales bacterium]MCB9589652.1 hypothetical protein [Polyangiaceae bacterium]
MLEHLPLKNVGPAPEMELELAPRLNLISLSFLERCAPFIAHELRRQKQLVRGDA